MNHFISVSSTWRPSRSVQKKAHEEGFSRVRLGIFIGPCLISLSFMVLSQRYCFCHTATVWPFLTSVSHHFDDALPSLFPFLNKLIFSRGSLSEEADEEATSAFKGFVHYSPKRGREREWASEREDEEEKQGKERHLSKQSAIEYIN